MRLAVIHEIVTRFEPACPGAIRELRLSPRTFDGQYVGSWRIDVDQDCRLDRVQDAYGNVTHTFSVSGPIRSLSITAAGEVDVDDTAGVLVGSARERLPPGLFRRTTPLTEPDAAIHALAGRCAAEAGPALLDRCHALKSGIYRDLDHVGAARDGLLKPACRTAAEVLSSGTADPVEGAHLFVAAARAFGAPARVVTGYLFRGDGRDDGDAAHAWAEAFIDGLGWIGFDPAEDRCPTDAYVRVCSSLDLAGACFLRGAEQGFSAAEVSSRARIAEVEN